MLGSAVNTNLTATLKDVATYAGVSLATVDRVLNGRGRARQNTVDRVRDAVNALGYQPNVNAVRLSRGGRRRFTVFVGKGSAAFVEMLAAAIVAYQDEWRRNGIDVELVRFAFEDVEHFCDQMTRHGKSRDGIAIMAPYHPAVIETVNVLAAGGLPVVTLVSDLPRSRRHGFAGIDNPSAGRTAGDLMSRFTQGGCGSIIVVSPASPIDDHQTRLAGFRQVIEDDCPGCPIINCLHTDDAAVGPLIAEAAGDPTDIRGIYSTGGLTRPIVDTLNEWQLSPRPVFIGHDLTPFSRRFLAAGTMDAVIGQSAEAEAAAAIDMLNAVCDGRHDIMSGLQIPIEIFMRHNLPAIGNSAVRVHDSQRSELSA